MSAASLETTMPPLLLRPTPSEELHALARTACDWSSQFLESIEEAFSGTPPTASASSEISATKNGEPSPGSVTNTTG
jgi:hypothetical protein